MTGIHQIHKRAGRETEKLEFLRGSLRTVLIWPVIGLFLAAMMWTLAFSRLDETRQGLKKEGIADVTSLSKVYAEQLQRSLEQIDQITLNLRHYWKSSGGTLRLENQLREGLYPISALLYVTIVDRDGEIITTTLSRKNKSTLADRDYFLKHKNSISDELQITKPRIGLGSGKLVIRFSRRLVADDGTFAGIVMVSVEPDYFAAFNADAGLGGAGFLSMVGDDGEVLATKRGDAIRPLPAIFNAPPVFDAATGFLTMGAEKFADRQPRAVAWQAVENYPVFAVAGLTEAEMLLPLETISSQSVRWVLGRTIVLMLFVLTGMFFSARLAWRKHQAAQVREVYGIATEGGSEGFFMWDALRDPQGVVNDFIITDCNERGASLYGLRKSEMLGRRLSSVYESRAYFEQLMRTYISAIEAGFYEDDFPIPPHSPMKLAWLHRKMMRSNTGLVLILRDISDSKAHEHALSSMANSDALTSLPNRHWMMGFLPFALERARSSNTILALLFVDLDDFKNINDTLGHAAGDELLQAVAARLRSVIRPTDSVVRLGGDEFTFILERPDSAHAVARVSERIIAVLNQPFLLAGESSHVVHASIGISIFPKDGDDVETLLKHADIAMYAAKENGKAGYQFFQPQLSEGLIARLSNEQALRAAIAKDEFELVYQPRVDAASGELRSMEALVRWVHPQRGIVLPGEFITLAEDTGLIVRLGELVIEKACSQMGRWRADKVPLVPVSINVSPRQFSQGNIAQLFKLHMTRHGITSSQVEMELTESCMMGDDLAIAEQLAAIKSLGVKLLIDDFGTGYSSLSQLQRLHPDILKVDKAFTSELGKGKEGEVFFQAIISMAQVLNISVVAEGVETLEQLRILQALCCNEIQGYYVSMPLSADDMAALMRKRFLFPEYRAALLAEPG
ncbi:MAG: EAL domain-containing protein [Pseudomonadota bacterium]